MNSRGAPTRLRASREIGIRETMRYELGWRVADPARHPDVVRAMDVAHDGITVGHTVRPTL